jgi:rhodanese-related sulfurtransferase
MLRRVLYETILIFLIAVILAFGSYFARPEAVLKKKEQQPASSADVSTGFAKPLSLEDARAMHASDQAVFADARTRQEYEKGHIAGAIWLDPFDFDQWSAKLAAEKPLDQIFITYCDGPQCPLARQLAEKLTWLGFEKVYYLENGWETWQTHRFPTATGG